jgi:DNA-binding MarR family transcriptional regulator
MTTSATGRPTQVGDEELIEAMLGAGRALASVALRSVQEAGDDVTLAQHRVLVELSGRGPQRVADLARVLSVDRSAATRMCDRLVRKRLVRRRRLGSDRRGVCVALTPQGSALVAAVRSRRQQEVARVVGRLQPDDRSAMLYALEAFASDDVREPDWSSGWLAPADARATTDGAATAGGADSR